MTFLDRITEVAPDTAANGHNPTDDIIEPVDPARWPDIDTFLSGDDPPYDWVIPNVAEAADRIILTGLEGHGKSTLVRQICVQIASGIHPFTGERIPPAPALIIDCENSTRQVRREIRPLRRTAGDAMDPALLRVRVIGSAINLAKPAVVDHLLRVIDTFQPRLIGLGPLYKLADGDPKDEQVGKAVADGLDRLRQQAGSTLLIEAHTPYADGGRSKRPIRPYGWSGWSRWPEFGIYLGPDGRLEHWRGQRDRDRIWPAALEQSSPWPWTAKELDEKPSWDGPTKCMDAIVAYLTGIAPAERSAYKLVDELRAHGAAYRRSTITEAAERAVIQGLLDASDGPRNSRIYRRAEHHEEEDEELF